MKKVVAVTSGGGDSITCGLMMLKEGYEVTFLHVDHGQKCELGERLACEAIVERLVERGYPCSLETVEFRWLGRLGGSGLTDPDIRVPDGLKGTFGSTIGTIFTPNRNSVLLSIAGALAERERAEVITFGCNQSEAAYPDNTKEYLDAYTKVLEYSCYHIHPRVISPEWEMDKVQIYKWAIDNDFSDILDLTWSCDDSPYYPHVADNPPTRRSDISMCGMCGCDRNRQLVYMLLGAPDNAKYANGDWFTRVFLPEIRSKGIPRAKWFSSYAKELGCKVI